MIEFKTAANKAETPEDEDYVEVPIDGEVYHARTPSAGQMALFAAAFADDLPGQAQAIFDMLEAMMGEEATRHIKQLLKDRSIDMGDLYGGGTELNPDAGLIDSIMEELAGRPTQPSTASSRSQASGGRKSTGRSPGKGSTRSGSPSTAS